MNPTEMNVEVNGIITNNLFALPPEAEGIVQKTVSDMNDVYQTALPLDQLQDIGQFILDNGPNLIDIAIGLIRLKDILSTRGKPAPAPQEIKSYILHAKGGVYTITGLTGTLTVTHD